MKTSGINWAPLLGILQLVFALVGLATGWIPSGSAITLLGTAMATFGFHASISNLQGQLKRAGKL